MAVIAQYGGPAARSPPPSFIATTSRGGLRATLTRCCLTAALVVGLPALFVNPAGRDGDHLAQLERLVPRIERAQTLSPEATQSISRLIERQSVGGGAADPSRQMRRKAAIERIIRAMQAKQNNATSGTVGGAMSD
ncbi:MAG: hypothetical protein WBW74_10605 [Xanthobacteraceae bacterium]